MYPWWELTKCVHFSKADGDLWSLSAVQVWEWAGSQDQKSFHVRGHLQRASGERAELFPPPVLQKQAVGHCHFKLAFVLGQEGFLVIHFQSEKCVCVSLVLHHRDANTGPSPLSQLWNTQAVGKQMGEGRFRVCHDRQSCTLCTLTGEGTLQERHWRAAEQAKALENKSWGTAEGTGVV